MKEDLKKLYNYLLEKKIVKFSGKNPEDALQSWQLYPEDMEGTWTNPLSIEEDDINTEEIQITPTLEESFEAPNITNKWVYPYSKAIEPDLLRSSVEDAVKRRYGKDSLILSREEVARNKWLNKALEEDIEYAKKTNQDKLLNQIIIMCGESDQGTHGEPGCFATAWIESPEEENYSLGTKIEGSDKRLYGEI